MEEAIRRKELPWIVRRFKLERSVDCWFKWSATVTVTQHSCPSAVLVVPCGGRSRHRRARRRCVLSCLAVVVPAIAVPAIVVPAVVVPCHGRRANCIAVAMPVVAVPCYGHNCPGHVRRHRARIHCASPWP